MAGFTVPIYTVVNRINNSINFFQPFIEAITNSLEANASLINIVLSFSKENLLLNNQTYKIDYVTITDNGEGFTEDNINSFTSYMSEHKIKLGCKGVSRIVWLKVFSCIKIESYVQDKKINILFDENFSKQNIHIDKLEDCLNNSSKTSISFLDIKEKYIKETTNLKINEFLDSLNEQIRKSLLVKFFLLSYDGRKFKINISSNESEYNLNISNDNILQFLTKDFFIEHNDNRFDFKLYYQFSNHKDLPNEIFYCANGITVLIPKKNKATLEIPKQNYAVFFVTSPYFDQNVNIERNEFEISESNDLVDELSWDIITPRIQEEIDSIIFEKFPNIQEDNKKIIFELENEYPHLAKYIEADSSKIKNKNKIINNAKKNFEHEKDVISNKFKKLLEENKIDANNFDEIISDISCIASRELAEYVVYRQQILSALEYMNDNNEKVEKRIHDIFMKMHTESYNKANELYENNLWILDDKYMTFIYAASDKQIKKYNEVLGGLTDSGEKYRPDIAIFFSNKFDSNKDVIVVEIKSSGASIDEKSKSFVEINRNAQAIRESFDNIDRIWCYTITKFNDKFENNIENQDFKPLFTNGKDKKLYYRYFINLDAHCYYISFDALLADAKARNKLFLDIICKNKR